MATYDYTQQQLSDTLANSGAFTTADRNAILSGLQKLGIFGEGGTAGALGRGESLFFGQSSTSNSEEFLIYSGSPTGPVEVTNANRAVTFDTADGVEVEIDATGRTLVATGSGDDAITSTGSSSDFIVAGDGDNSVSAGSGSDTVYSGTGNDTIFGGSGNDFISSGGGDDSVDGGAGADTIYSGSGDDTVFGGAGDDGIDAGDGDNLVDGGSGNDMIFVGDGNDTVYAGTGSDIVYGGGGDNVIDGGTGNDTVIVGGGDDLIYGGSGNDSFSLMSEGGTIGDDTVYGGSGNDTLYVDRLQSEVVDTVITDSYTEVTFDNGDTLRIYEVETITYKPTV
jgi:Ca2+-binding RTX toxin-like protein